MPGRTPSPPVLRHPSSGRQVGRLGAAIILVGFLLLTPGAAAQPFLLSTGAQVSGSLTVPDDPRDLQDGTLIFSGALDHSGTFQGPFVAMQTGPETAITAPLVRIYDIHDALAIAQQRPLLELHDATLVPDPGASFYWALPEAELVAASAHTFAFLFNIEANLPDIELILPTRDEEAPPSLIAQARGTPWTIDAPGTDRSVFLPIAGGFRAIDTDGTDEHFAGNDWLVTIRGTTRGSVQAEGVAVPFEPGATAAFRPATGSEAQDAFSARALQDFLDVASDLAAGYSPPESLPDEGSDPICQEHPEACAAFLNGQSGDGALGDLPDGLLDGLQDEASLPAIDTPLGSPGDGAHEAITLPQGVAAALDELGPFLHGAFFGKIDEPLTIGTRHHDAAGFTVVRFDTLTLTSKDGGVVGFSGTSPFAYSGGTVYHENEMTRVGPVVVSILSIVLYGLAIGSWILTRKWRARPLDETLTKRLRPAAMIAQIGLFGVGFVLFDREVHFILGQSILGNIGLHGGSAALTGATMALSGTGGILLVQLLLWGAATAAFGVPIALLVRSALKAGGLGRPAYGFAIGFGAVGAWLLGTSMILPILDVVFGSAAAAFA